MKDFFKETAWFCMEMLALACFTVFAITMMFVFWVTDLFRREKR